MRDGLGTVPHIAGPQERLPSAARIGILAGRLAALPIRLGAVSILVGVGAKHGDIQPRRIEVPPRGEGERLVDLTPSRRTREGATCSIRAIILLTLRAFGFVGRWIAGPVVRVPLVVPGAGAEAGITSPDARPGPPLRA